MAEDTSNCIPYKGPDSYLLPAESGEQGPWGRGPTCEKRARTEEVFICSFSRLNLEPFICRPIDGQCLRYSSRPLEERIGATFRKQRTAHSFSRPCFPCPKTIEPHGFRGLGKCSLVGPAAPSASPAAHGHRLLLRGAVAGTNPADRGAGRAGELD